MAWKAVLVISMSISGHRPLLSERRKKWGTLLNVECTPTSYALCLSGGFMNAVAFQLSSLALKTEMMGLWCSDSKPREIQALGDG